MSKALEKKIKKIEKLEKKKQEIEKTIKGIMDEFYIKCGRILLHAYGGTKKRKYRGKRQTKKRKYKKI